MSAHVLFHLDPAAARPRFGYRQVTSIAKKWSKTSRVG